MLAMICRCGHPKHEHQHYRRGTDCARCSCIKFQWRWMSFLAARTRRKPSSGDALTARQQPASLLKAAISSFARYRR
jgi:hypothetical protein